MVTIRNNSTLRGMSTFEILLAFAILTLSLTAVISILYGNQTAVVDTQTGTEALSRAQSLIQTAQASSKSNYSSVVTATSSEKIDSILYQKDLTVFDVTPCLKIATGTVSWATTTLRSQKIELATILSDVAGAIALGQHCMASPPNGDWQTIGQVSGGNGAVNGTGVYAQNGVAYVTVNSIVANKPDLLIYSLDALKNIVTHGNVDVSSFTGLGTSNGLSGVVVIGKYAYAVNSQKDNQLVLIDVSNIENPFVFKSVTLHNITSKSTCPTSTDCLLGGRSIFYYSGYLYIGTGYLAFGSSGSNQEFQVYCISDVAVPSCSPTNPVWIGGVNVGRNVNAIVVRGQYAYLATSNGSGELTVIDLNNLSGTPIEIDAAGEEDAYSLAIVGNKLYLGRAHGTATEPNFLIYDISNPASPVQKGSKNYAEDINAISVFSGIAFLATTNNFEVINITTPSAITTIKSLSLQKPGMGVDYDSSYIYVPIQKQGSVLLDVFYPGS